MKIQLKTTPVFGKNYTALKDDSIRFIVNRGGSRSSKTYSIIQLIIWYAFTHPGSLISVCRKTSPALHATVYKDFVDIATDLDVLEQLVQNKTRGTFTFPNESVVQFFSIDEAQKLRGRKHDLVYVNEANEISAQEFLQLNLRTRNKIIVDFNPSDEIEWILNLLRNPENSIEIHSTYKDNTFLENSIIKEIENLINTDYTQYQIYALGVYPIGKERVFSNVFTGEFPETDNFMYGMDFGYNDPSTIIKVYIKDGTCYIHEELFESYLNTEQLLAKMLAIGISKRHPIYADSARPDLIDSMRKAGYYVIPGHKKIIEGVDYLKSHKLVITKSSDNTYKEFKHYSYKIVKDKITDMPVDFKNHAIDAARYAAFSTKQERKTSFYVR